MTQSQEGLNYVPILSRNISPPPSSRSCLSISKNRSQCCSLSYNGNYEGDITMFEDKGYELERLNLLDSESDDDNDESNGINRSSRKLIVNMRRTRTVQHSLLWRLLLHFIWYFCKPELQLQIVERLERIMDSFWYKKFVIYFNGLRFICEFILQFVVKIIKYLAFLCHFLWTRRLIFHQILRRILWCLTLSKCNDLGLFAFTLVCSPILFIVAFMGFTVALCGCLREKIQHWSYTIKFKLI